MAGNIPWTPEAIMCKAKEFDTLTDFNRLARSAAMAAKRLGIHAEVVAHMEKKEMHWTFDKIINITRGIATLAVLNRDYRNVAKAAKRLGIFEEVTAHMTTKMPDQFRDVKGKTGVYFLYSGLEIVYIGKSVSDVYGRLAKHTLDNSKVFNKVTVYEIINKADINIAEMYLIGRHAPKYNINSNDGDTPTLEVLHLDAIIKSETTIMIGEL